ncbi:unnamed protein product [Caenorhabditis sp. 36 PRJEB53466]|nr:unnamed protein product [Caenorhabditis sp. 36 PRJEB53466]
MSSSSFATVTKVVQEFEAKCARAPGHCEKVYEKLENECFRAIFGVSDTCIDNLHVAKVVFCGRSRAKAPQFCGPRARRHLRQAPNDQDPAPIGQTPVSRAPPRPAQVPAGPAPEPPAPSPSTGGTSSKMTLFLGVGAVGCLFLCGALALAAFLFVRKQAKEKEEMEARKKVKQQPTEPGRMTKQKKKKEKEGRKGSQMKTVGDETRVERQEAREKERREEQHRWNIFHEANQKENSFIS